jgi:1,2-phenylacetyl-CoA epoxidase catalytic subunit
MTIDFGQPTFIEAANEFFGRQRDPDELARLFAIFRVGEHHAVITIGDWLKSTPELEVKAGFSRLVWDEARHTQIWTDRMSELVGEEAVDRLYPDPRQVTFANHEYFRLWDEYARADCLPKRLAYIYVVDGWAAVAYDVYLNHIDPVTKWHLGTILADEHFHVAFGRQMAEKYLTSERDKELLAREEEKISGILQDVTDGFLRSDV